MELHWLLQVSVKVNPSFFLPRSLPIFSYVSLKSLELSLFFFFFPFVFCSKLSRFWIPRKLCHQRCVFQTPRISFLFLPREQNFNRGYDIRIPFHEEFFKGKGNAVGSEISQFLREIVEGYEACAGLFRTGSPSSPSTPSAVQFTFTIDRTSRLCKSIPRNRIACLYFGLQLDTDDNNSCNFHRLLFVFLVSYRLASYLTI